jgi:hypothetical protein
LDSAYEIEGVGLDDREEEGADGAEPLKVYSQVKIEASASGTTALADKGRVIKGGAMGAKGNIA